MKDLATIGLPLQIGGAALAVAGIVTGLAANAIAGLWIAATGLAAHVVGDAFFYFQMKRQKCI